MKPSVADQEERIVVNVDGKLVEVILNEAARNTARDEYSHSFLASTITAAVQSIMSTGYVVGQILVDNISKTETEIRFYDACGQEIRRNVIPVIARSNAYSLGQDYLSRLERAGTMDPELLSKARAILEKGGEQRTD